MKDKLKKLPPEFKRILKSASKLAGDFGCRISLVGGVVRDLLLGGDVFDLDIVVEGDAIAFVSQLAQRLRGDYTKHHAFGTATVYFNSHKIDFATARTEIYSHWGVLPKVKPAGLLEDLQRRDFTINAMAIGLNHDDYGKVIDFYGGLSDLNKGLLRVLHKESFLEDPTRILRGTRFKERFGFAFEPRTQALLKQASSKRVLNLVSPHRLRDELICMLKEPSPYRCLKALDRLGSLYFIDKKVTLDKQAAVLFRRINSAVAWYDKTFKNHRRLDQWIIYLAAILVSLSQKRIENLLSEFGFKKGERIIVVSIKKGIKSANQINRKKEPYNIYEYLKNYSFEAVLFFYAYFNDKHSRRNIEYFFKALACIRLDTRGRDLKDMSLSPSALYGKALQGLLKAKIKKGLSGKEQELKEVEKIFRRLYKKHMSCGG
jgi:tRNA nucleotidyltransferase (CCA-adding enzyme)